MSVFADKTFLQGLQRGTMLCLALLRTTVAAVTVAVTVRHQVQSEFWSSREAWGQSLSYIRPM